MTGDDDGAVVAHPPEFWCVRPPGGIRQEQGLPDEIAEAETRRYRGYCAGTGRISRPPDCPDAGQPGRHSTRVLLPIPGNRSPAPSGDCPGWR